MSSDDSRLAESLAVPSFSHVEISSKPLKTCTYMGLRRASKPNLNPYFLRHPTSSDCFASLRPSGT